jgi:hypothetical protein
MRQKIKQNADEVVINHSGDLFNEMLISFVFMALLFNLFENSEKLIYYICDLILYEVF